MMRPCDNCLENKWLYEKLDNGFIKATCTFCTHEVEWDTGKAPVQKDGDKCRKCKTPVQLLPLKVTPKKLKNPYYYSHWLKCPKCHTTYTNEDYKVITGKKVDLPENIVENEDGTLSFK